MARAVPPWLHRVCIRIHGPADPWTRLVLFALNTFMNEEGTSFQGQDSIAKAACMGVSTVRSKLGDASRDGWVALYTRGKEGQRWKSYVYRSCVPDWIDLSTIAGAENLIDSHEAKYGVIEPGAVSGSLYPQEGRARQPPPAGGGPLPVDNSRKTESTASRRGKHRQLKREAPPADSEKHRQPVGGKSSLKFSISTQSKVPPLSRGTADGLSSISGTETGKRKTADPAEQLRKARRHIEVDSQVSDATLAKCYRLTTDQLTEVRRP